MISDDEHRHIMRNWSVLKDNIKEQGRLEVFYQYKYKEAEENKDRFIREEDVYTGLYGDAIEEYEAAHPPKEI